MKKNSAIFYSLLLVIGDFLALVAAFSSAYILRVKYDTRPLIEQIPSREYLKIFLTILPLWILVHSFIGLYNKDVYSNRFKELGRLIVGSLLGMLVIIGYDFVVEKSIFPARLVAVYGFLLSLALLIIFRAFARLLRSLLFAYGVGVNNVLVIGDNPASKTIIDELCHTKRTGHKIIGIVSTTKSTKYSTFKDFDEAIKKLKNIDTIIQTVMYKDSTKNDEIMIYAQTHHISYNFTPGNNELFVGNLEVQLFRGTPVVTVHQTPLTGWGKVFKRAFDIVVSLILIIVLSPILLLVAILIKISDPKSPVLFRQNRLTQFNNQFKVYKFRSMKSGMNAQSPEETFKKMGREDLIAEFRKNNDQLADDPRISKIGKFIRTTSIDELPQLFNVFLGDISLVGPRALIPQELDQYSKKHNILSIKSGITGLAQVSGRKDITFDERRKLDLYYVQNWSFWLDITILLRTLRAVINGIGAK